MSATSSLGAWLRALALLSSLAVAGLCGACAPRNAKPEAGPDPSLLAGDSLERESNEIRLELIHHLLEAGNHDMAVPLIRKVLAEQPDSGLAHFYMGRVLVMQKQDGLAQKEFEVALARLPKMLPALDALAQVHARASRFDQSLALFDRALALDATSPRLHHNKAYVLFLAGRDEAAVEAYQRAISLDPRSSMAYTNLGFAFGRLGRYEEARGAFARGGTEAAAAVNLGLVYELKGADEKAERAYLRALKLQPEHPVARANLDALRRRKAQGPGKGDGETR